MVHLNSPKDVVRLRETMPFLTFQQVRVFAKLDDLRPSFRGMGLPTSVIGFGRRSSSLEGLGDSISHLVVGTAAHGIILNLKSLEGIAAQNRLLIMDLSIHHARDDEPILS